MTGEAVLILLDLGRTRHHLRARRDVRVGADLQDLWGRAAGRCALCNGELAINAPGGSDREALVGDECQIVVEDHSRLACVELHGADSGAAAAVTLRRAAAWMREQGAGRPRR